MVHLQLTPARGNAIDRAYGNSTMLTARLQRKHGQHDVRDLRVEQEDSWSAEVNKDQVGQVDPERLHSPLGLGIKKGQDVCFEPTCL